MKKTIAKILIIAGLIGMCYPFAARVWNRHRQDAIATKYQETVEKKDESEIEKELSDAEVYNKDLAEIPGDKVARFEEETSEKYESLLDPEGSGIMGYLSIPRINVSIPIYHYSFDEQLSLGTGHIHGSSLPVGGKGTHSVITGHRGLPTNKMLTDLNLLEKGDVFSIHVLDRTLNYKVDRIRVVDPYDLSDLGIDDDKDYVTLVTCTPYGVNTKRLLVRGIRTDEETTEKNVLAVLNPGNLRSSEWPAYAFFFAAVVIIVWIITKFIIRRKREKG